MSVTECDPMPSGADSSVNTHEAFFQEPSDSIAKKAHWERLSRMSLEWLSRNGRGRLSIHSEDIVQRFDKFSASLDTRTTNAMIVHDDNDSGQRQLMIAEECVVWEDDRYVYMQLRGRTVSRTEGNSVGMMPRRRNTRNPIPISDY